MEYYRRPPLAEAPSKPKRETDLLVDRLTEAVYRKMRQECPSFSFDEALFRTLFRQAAGHEGLLPSNKEGYGVRLREVERRIKKRLDSAQQRASRRPKQTDPTDNDRPFSKYSWPDDTGASIEKSLPPRDRD